MQITDIGYGRGWLDISAARSLWRIDARLGRPLDINEAGRTWAQQNKFRQDYLNGVPGAAFALPAGTSIHEQGRAIDTDDRFIAIMNDHGWFQTALARSEPWHFEYDYNRDNHRNEPASGGNDMGTLDDTEANYQIFAKWQQRGFRYDIRPNGLGADWKYGPTVFEMLTNADDDNAIANAIKANAAETDKLAVLVAGLGGVDLEVDTDKLVAELRAGLAPEIVKALAEALGSASEVDPPKA